MVPVIEVQDLSIGYNSDEPLLGGLNFRLEGPALIQILGPNGAGKTTFLKTIAGLLKPLSGKVFINGIDVTALPEKAGAFVGYVPQLSIQKGHYPVTVWEAVSMPLLLRKHRWPRLGLSRAEKTIVEKVLARVGLPREKWHESLWRLSGGERQRVMIARALVYDPPILVMDEPFSAVDPRGRAELAKFIASLARTKLVLVTTHDPMLLIEYTNTIILINRGFFAIGKPEEVLTLENTRRVYGEAAKLVVQHIHISDYH
ncbi:MAG: metal ABC transporter ATP-binding protein [Pyrodictiaceae archaeon]